MVLDTLISEGAKALFNVVSGYIGSDEDKEKVKLEIQKLAVEQAKAMNAEMDSARNLTMALAGKTKVVWSAPVLSGIICLGFFGVLFSLLRSEIPEGSQDVALIMLGILGQGFAQVTGFWLGSSKSSADKTEMLAASMPPPRPQSATQPIDWGN